MNLFRNLCQEGLKNLYLQAKQLSSKFTCKWKHLTRDKNQAADYLSKVALQETQTFSYDAQSDYNPHDRWDQLKILLTKDSEARSPT